MEPEPEWKLIPTEEEMKTYLRTETYYMPKKNFYDDPHNRNIRKLAVSVVAKKWNSISGDDIFVPYLAMNYFDNFVSHTHTERTFTIEEVPRIANACIAIAAKIRKSNTFSNVFEGSYTQEIEMVEAWFRCNGERLKHPVNPFCFVNYHYSTFARIKGNINRRCIDEMIIHSQGEDDFIGYRPAEIAYSSFLAAIRIANPSITFSSLKLPDGLNRCDEKLYRLYQKNNKVEICGLEAIPSSTIAPKDISKELAKEDATSEIKG